MDGNGVTRREFEDLRNELRDLRREVARLEREGSAATKLLADRVKTNYENARDDIKELQAFNTWFVRGLIASVLLAVVVAFILQNKGTP